MINKNNNNLNALRILGVEAINKANSGHPGIVLGAAPIVYVLFNKIMKHNPQNPKWFNRDRFVLSAGHGSGLLYSALHLAGYKMSIEDLKQFRQLNSKTPGHPESHLTEGVELTSGPLGQGIAMGVGLAVGEAHLAAIYNQVNQLVDHHTFVLCGDGDLQEGVAQEAISFAGKQRLNKLILIHDSNDIQLDTQVNDVQIEDMHMRFKAAGWNTLKINDGEDLQAIEAAIKQAQKSNKPTYIEVKTIIGFGATSQGTSTVHGAPVGKDLVNIKDQFGWTSQPFEVPTDVYEHWKQNCLTKNLVINQQWDNLLEQLKKTNASLAQQFVKQIKGEIEFDFASLLASVPTKPEATRVSSGKIFDAINQQVKLLIGGSADLVSSTKIKGADGIFSEQNRQGRNILYGVREFGMGAINNGIYQHGGLIPFASGFFVFADYMKASMRLASIMQTQTLFIFTHDSVAVGEDGPTHQPIEQLAMIRAIPNHVLIRPADYAETVAAYQIALQDLKKTPTTIVLTRQDLLQLAHNDVYQQVKKGGYVIKESINPQLTLIASGSEVGLAMQVADKFNQIQISTRVVSMPSTNLFDQQSQAYQDEVLDRSTLRVSLEMGTTFGWAKYTGTDGINIGIDTFGTSAPGDQVIEAFGFTSEQIFNKIKQAMKK